MKSRAHRRLLPIDAPPVSRSVARQLAAIFCQAVQAQVQETETQARPEELEPWLRRYWADGFSLPNSPMHEWLYGQLSRCDRQRGVRANLIGPRSNAKSQITTGYALRAAVEGREPYIWIVSDVDEQAEGNLDSIREQIEDNRLLRMAYPEACGRGKKWRSGRIDLSNGVTIQAFGMMAKMRGRKKGSQRPSLIIGDDLQNDSIQTSGEQRQKQQRRFDDVIMNAGTPRTNFVVVGTALHRECIVENLKKRPGWRSRSFSSIVHWPERMDLWERWAQIFHDRETHGDEAEDVADAFYILNRKEMDAGAEVLWPAFENLATLMKLRETSGRSGFEREKQSNPITPETCFFPDEWFHDGIWFNEWPTDARVWVMALDPSLGKTDHSDYSAYVWGCIDRNNVMYIDASIARRTVPALVEDGVTLWARLLPTAFFVESNQFQELLIGQFSHAAARRGFPMVASRVTNTENKEVRIRRLEPWFQAGNVRVKRSPGGMLLIEQLRQFPNAMHDDGPDALEVWIRGLLGIQRRAA